MLSIDNSVSAPSTRRRDAATVRSGPLLNGRPGPDPSRCEYCLGLRKARVCGDNRVHSLSRHPEHLRDLGHADQMVHGATL